jgi:ribonuclease-3
MRLSRGVHQGGGRNSDALLCNTFEAVVGALYLSCGLIPTQQFLHPLLEGAQVDRVVQTEEYNPKSRLQEWSQSMKMGIPRYVIVETGGSGHEPVFIVEVEISGKVFGRGTGTNKLLASQTAAGNALENIEAGTL